MKKLNFKSLLVSLFCVAASLSGFAQTPQPDTSFGTQGIVNLGEFKVSGMRAFPNGKIILASLSYTFPSYYLRIRRYLASGSLDSSYSTMGEMETTVSTSVYFKPAILSNEKVLLADDYIAISTCGARAYNGNGIDSSFGTNGKVGFWGQNNVNFNGIFLDSSDRFFAFGDQIVFSELSTVFVAMNKLGQPLPAYSTGYGRSQCSTSDESQLFAMNLGSNKKLLFAGKLGSWSGPPKLFIARNDSLGNADMTFNGGNSVEYPTDQGVVGLKQLSSGKILCSLTRSLYMLLPNGSPDPDFGVGGIVSTKLDTHSIDMLGYIEMSDGKILAYGKKNSKAAFQRFFGNGQIDSSFAMNGTLELDIAGQAADVRIIGDTLLSSGSNFIMRYLLSPVTGVQKSNRSKPLVVYPNPAQNTITISSPNELGKEICFWNATGQSFRKALQNPAHQRVDVSDLTPGLYYYQAKGRNGEIYGGKLLITR